ncbi:MAG: methyltransferase domain-containing protein [Nanoarchaeota archaeon]
MESETEFWERLRKRREVVQSAHDLLLQKVFQDVKGRVLEIGAAFGYLRSKVGRGQWVELDVERYSQNQHRPSVRADVLAIPFTDKSFEVVCGLASYDMAVDLEKALDETYRVLKEGGRFIHILDLGANSDAVTEYLENQGYKVMASRRTKEFLFFQHPSQKRFNWRYISPENVPLFEQEKHPIDPEDLDVDLLEAVREWERVFDKYAKPLDVTQVFNDRLLAGLRKRFKNAKVELVAKDIIANEKEIHREFGKRAYETTPHNVTASPIRSAWYSFTSLIFQPKVYERAVAYVAVAEK